MLTLFVSFFGMPAIGMLLSLRARRQLATHPNLAGRGWVLAAIILNSIVCTAFVLLLIGL